MLIKLSEKEYIDPTKIESVFYSKSQGCTVIHMASGHKLMDVDRTPKEIIDILIREGVK